MRNLLIGILLAGAAVTPALAQDNGDHRWHHDQQQGDRQQAHQERQQARQEQQQARAQMRAERFNGGGNFNREQQMPQFVREQQQVQVQEGRGGGGWGGRLEGRQGFEGRQNVAPQADVREQAYEYRGPAQVERNRNGGWARSYPQANVVEQQQQVREWNRSGSGWTRGGDYRQGQAVQQQYYRGGTRYAGTWNRDWRNDRRYDWRRYRDHHRSIFHLGLYIDPFGYGYQPFSIGYRMPPVYFGEQYWIDPALYGLPYPPPGTQWVRYWNDALLIDMYSGEVVDVIQGFFW